MKIEQQKQEFRPVVITLESEKEVRQMEELFRLFLSCHHRHESMPDELVQSAHALKSRLNAL
jgi:hypothetical protein